MLILLFNQSNFVCVHACVCACVCVCEGGGEQVYQKDLWFLLQTFIFPVLWQ
jgi:hypothetical protein